MQLAPTAAQAQKTRYSNFTAAANTNPAPPKKLCLFHQSSIPPFLWQRYNTWHLRSFAPFGFCNMLLVSLQFCYDHLYILNFPPFFLVRGLLLVKLGDILRIFATLFRRPAQDDLLHMASVSWSGFSGKTWEWLDNQTFKQETWQKIMHKCWIFHCYGSCQRVNHCMYSVYI